jgi:hypothetical protein
MLDLKRFLSTASQPQPQTLVYAVIILGMVILFVIFVSMYRQHSHAYQMSQESNATVQLNTTINNVRPFGSLRDYYIMASYNTCVEGPYNGGAVSLTYLKNAIALGYRFLDFEIYSSNTDDPIVSCSTVVTDCGTDATTFYSIPFVDVMQVIDQYAFTNSGCMNFKDPLIVNLRIKTCNVNVLQKLADIFKSYPTRMLGPMYSFNAQNSNFGDARMETLMGHICLFVDSTTVDYSSNTAFMEYVNSSNITGFMKQITQTGFKNTPDLKELIEYNKRNMTIVLPDYTDPRNSVIQVFQNAGCQVKAMMIWESGSYMQENNKVFNDTYHCAFVLKPEKLRYIPRLIDAPKPQDPANSYAARPLDTGVAGIKFDI